MAKEIMKVRDKKTSKIYDCFLQTVQLNFDGKYYMRYNIGINGYNEWSNICCVYDNDEFNNNYEIIK